MKIVDLIIKIANKEELPQTIEYNGDIGKLVQENDFINYIFEKDGNIYDLYWLREHNLNNVNDEVFERKLK